MIVKAELVGASSHGLSRLKMYINRIKRKVINNSPKIKIKKISKSISLIDADNSIGFVGGDVGIKQAIKNAKSSGIGIVAIKNSGHYGLSSFYAEQAVKKNMLVFCFTNAPPALAPHGAKKSLFGTNPICFGTPTGTKVPFIFSWRVQCLMDYCLALSITECLQFVHYSESILIRNLRDRELMELCTVRYLEMLCQTE